MGFYIEVPQDKNKAQQIVELHGGVILPHAPYQDSWKSPILFSSIPDGKALIVVIDNGLFEAAAYAYNPNELAALTDPYDLRPKQFMLMDKTIAEQLTGFKHG